MTPSVKPHRRHWLTLSMGLILAGCGGGSDDPPIDDRLPGLERRPINLSCVAPPRPAEAAEFRLEPVLSALATAPVTGLVADPSVDEGWYLLEQSGRIHRRAVTPGSDGLLIDLTDRVAANGEGGLLGLALHPDYPETPEAFISYTRRGAPLISHVSRFTSADGGHTLDPSSEQVLLTLDQPSIVHQGGHLAFGPDGYLYIGFGDGGPPGWPEEGPASPGPAQDTDNWFGALLRIDVDSGDSYAIPPDNPFAHGGGRPEIHAWGFRNPWRWSFDRATGELWLGDVGETGFEEINRVERGGNYGWALREGPGCFPYEVTDCPTRDLIDPVHFYDRGDGCAIIGGAVYRGQALPALQGQYVFGDFCTGRLWRLSYDDPDTPRHDPLAGASIRISAIAEDPQGELHLIDYESGAVYRLAGGSDPVEDEAFPRKLSQTGCVDPDDPTRPAEGLIPYAVNAAFWADGATKNRWLALPEGRTIRIGQDGDWELPVGSVVLKNFRLAGELIESRLLVRHEDGGWAGYSYAWNEAGDDADYVPGGAVRRIRDQDWMYPSSTRCLRCHTEAAGHTLGLETVQLNREQFYPASGVEAAQLSTLNHIGLFDRPLDTRPGRQPALADPLDESAPLDARVRAYLHTNCAQCHRLGGPTRLDMDLRHTTRLPDMGVCDVPATGSSLGMAGARRLAPGEPERSLLLARLARRDLYRMPPLASNLIDTDGVALLRDWIGQLAGCN